ncbi:MAG: nucleotidyltransferase domain-containing protein [Nanoarchaeota archaeon]
MIYSKQELIKPTITVGNSAGVLLPSSWKNSTVRVCLVEQPHLDEVLKIIDPVEIQGIYLCGSYAKNEQTEESDIDLLVVNEKKEGTIKKGKYEINYITQESLNKMEAILYYPMILESKTLLNKSLLERLKKETYLSKKILSEYLRATKKMLKLNELEITLAEKEKRKNVSSSISYSLVLRLRTYYILKQIKKKKIWKKSQFLKLIKDLTGSHKAYKSYLNMKNNKKVNDLSVIDARKLLNYLKKETEKWEKDLKKPSSKLKA